MTLLSIVFLYVLSSFCFIVYIKSLKKVLSWGGWALLLIALSLHTFLVLQRAFEAQRFPFTNMFGTLLMFSWFVILLGMILFRTYPIPSVRTISLLISSSILLFAFFLSSEIPPLMPALKSGWLYFHVISYFIAYACFAITFGLSMLYVSLFFYKSNKSQQEILDALEGLIFRIMDIGFPFLTTGIACGSLWANISWGRFWNWDAKEVWALVTWLIYAGCLHLRHAKNLKGIYAPLIALLGFIAIIFTYVGVNLFFTTLHSYS